VELSLTDLAIDDPCLLFALRREAQPFYREFRPQQRFPGAPCPARFCGPEWLSVLVLETGIGSKCAAEAVSWALGGPMLEQVPYRPKVVIAAGFGGALQDSLAVGDVVLATEVVDEAGTCWPTTWPGDLPAGEWRPPLHRGRLLSVETLAAEAAQKNSLGQTHAALAVDMESAAVARLCSRRDVPFGCVRAISDTLPTSLSPLLVPLFADSRVSPLRLARAVLKSPRLAGELWRLLGATQKAGLQLQKALGELLTLTLPWGKEL
jgi:adenosylhomocysteine nucleosidase